MNEDDLRDCFAMFALMGYMSKLALNPLEVGAICEKGAFAENNAEAISKASYIMADSMLNARKPQEEEGIVAIKKRKYDRKAAKE